MKKEVLLLGVVVVGLCASSALALVPLGPTATCLQKGQWAFGGEVSNVDMRLKIPAITGFFRDPDNMGLMKMSLDINQYCAVVRRGITDNWEAFARVGFADMKYDRPSGSSTWKGDDDDVIWGLGTKATFWEQTPNLKWGIGGQVTWAEFGGARSNPDADEEFGKFELEFRELQIAAGPTWTPPDMEWLSIYGGLFYHDVGGYHEFWHEDDYRRYPIHEREDWGLFLGAQIARDSIIFNVEYMDTDECDALAVSALWMTQ